MPKSNVAVIHLTGFVVINSLSIGHLKSREDKYVFICNIKEDADAEYGHSTANRGILMVFAYRHNYTVSNSASIVGLD